MRKRLILLVFVCALALTGCDLLSPVGESTAPAVTTATPICSDAPSTEPVPTAPETEAETAPPVTEYFPNVTDDDHTKRY